MKFLDKQTIGSLSPGQAHTETETRMNDVREKTRFILPIFASNRESFLGVLQ